MSAAHDRLATERWLRQLDASLLEAWANRGLLRRAQGVLPQVQASRSEPGFECSVEAQIQRLRGPGFQHLRCSCPAAGACHHAVAALLFWSARVQDIESTPAEEPIATAQPLWRGSEWKDIAAMFSGAHLRRAAQWLDEGLSLNFEQDEQRLQTRLPSGEVVRLHAEGVEDSACSCDRPRCAHRLVALLAWRRQNGFDDGPLPIPVRPRREQMAVHEVEACLLDLAEHGLGSLSSAWIRALLALALRCRQAELPALATDLRQLAEAAEDEHARRRSARPQAMQRSLARCWARCRALQAPHSPQSRVSLRGRHRRDYQPAQPLQLRVLGFEYWRAQEDRAGAHLHAWCERSQRWWRLSSVNGGAGMLAQEHELLDWGGLELSAVLGRSFTIEDALASSDGSLRLRSPLPAETFACADVMPSLAPGEAMSHIPQSPPPTDAALDLSEAQCRWHAAQPHGLLDAQPQVMLIGPLQLTPSAGVDVPWFAFDAAPGSDNTALELRFDPRGAEHRRARRRLQHLQSQGVGEVHVLGWFDSLNGQPRLQPLSLWCPQHARWLHLHAAQTPALQRVPEDMPPHTAATLNPTPPVPALPMRNSGQTPLHHTHQDLIQALNDTHALLGQRLSTGCAHPDPGFALSLLRWSNEGLGIHWPELVAGLSAQPAAPEQASVQARALLDALLRCELALQIETARPWRAHCVLATAEDSYTQAPTPV